MQTFGTSKRLDAKSLQERDVRRLLIISFCKVVLTTSPWSLKGVDSEAVQLRRLAKKCGSDGSKPGGGLITQSPSITINHSVGRYGISILDIEDMHRLFSNATSVGKPKGNVWLCFPNDRVRGCNGRRCWLEDGKVIVQSESPS